MGLGEQHLAGWIIRQGGLPVGGAPPWYLGDLVTVPGAAFLQLFNSSHVGGLGLEA